jgi:CRISPR system Cascade subunit CasE
MNLSRLILNPRSRVVRRDLADCHEMHRTLLSAFPEEVGDPRVGARAEFALLYRLELERAAGGIRVLVQSRVPPDWTQLPKGYLLDTGLDSENPACKSVEAHYAWMTTGQRFVFRLRANPTRKVETKSSADGTRRNGRRVDLRNDAAREAWLGRKAAAGGFRILSVQIDPRVPNIRDIVEAPITGRRQGRLLTFGSVLFDGVLQVSDAAAFQQTLAQGIGPGKAYGFGLLSIAPIAVPSGS